MDWTNYERYDVVDIAFIVDNPYLELHFNEIMLDIFPFFMNFIAWFYIYLIIFLKILWNHY